MFKVQKILEKKDTSANSWFNNLYIQVYCTVQQWKYWLAILRETCS